jgi:multiple sugar transport system substrate-binding protein
MVTAAQDADSPITIPAAQTELPTGDVTFRWLDGGGGTRPNFFIPYFKAYKEAHPNITAHYDNLPWPEVQQVVPLGVQNGNAPDVFALPLNISSAQAVREGWIAPLDDVVPNFEEWKAAFPPNTFLNGVSQFDGKTYTFPTESSKRYNLLLYNLEYLEQSGYDPVASPLTWDEFRDAARKITERGQGQYFGLILGGQQANEFSNFVSNLGRMAGASAGPDDIDWRTGEYVYASDEYLAAIELLLAIRDDGSIFPGSVNLNAPQARGQFPQGVAGMMLQGTWNIPQWRSEAPDFEFGVASQPVPNDRQPLPLTYRPGGANHYYLYANSPLGAVAGDMFAYIGSPEGHVPWKILVGPAAPPVFADAVKHVEIDPLAAYAFDLYDQQMRASPLPVVRNQDVALVELEFQPITPNYGETIQGIYSGQLDDPKAAMQDLQERSEAELERAIKAAQDKGAQVSRDDWVFPNWDPTRDYTEEDYADLDG